MNHYLTLSSALLGTTSLAGMIAFLPVSSHAACTTSDPNAGETVTCTDSDTSGVQGAVGVDDVTVIVEEGAAITREPGNVFGIRGQGDDWSVINSGTITSSWRGVSILSGSVENTATGVIDAQDYAIHIPATGGFGTVINDGILTSEGRHAVALSAGGSVVNTGTITGAFTTDTTVNYGGVYISSGGQVTNAEGATIEGAYGVILFGESHVDNAGTISGATHIALQLTDGGTVDNSGEIEGATFGVWARDGAAEIVNSGSVTANGDAIYFGSGGTVENHAGGLISGSTGVSMVGGGTVTNDATATIRGMSYAVSFDDGQGEVVNAGDIISDTAYGVRLAAGGSVDNLDGGTITGGNFGIWVDGGSGNVTNAGAIAGHTTHGITMSEGGSVNNLSGGTIEGASLGIYIDGGGVVTNEEGARIEGQNFGGIVLLGQSEVSNAGTIIGHGNAAPASPGVRMNDGGILANAATGIIEGPGYGVYVESGGSADISNAGTITGNGIDGVRLDAGGAIDNRSGGTIEGARYGVSLYGGGSVTNHGTITGGDLAVFFDATSSASTLTNRGTLAGGVQMSDGDATLEIATGSTISGPVDAGEGSGDKVLRLIGSGSDSYDGSFTGFRTLEIDSSEGGSWTLVGDQSFADGTTISQGSLIVNFNLLNDVIVEEGGILGGTGTVGTTTVASGGTIAPGNSIGTLTVDGDITFESGSTYEVEVDPAGSDSDLVHATGEASIDSGASVAHVGLDGVYAAGSTYIILTAEDGVEGEFGTVSSDFAFLDAELSYDATSVFLELVRNDVSFPDVAETPNESEAAEGAESLGDGHPVHDAIAGLPDEPAVIRGAFDALSGEIHASARTALIEDSRFVRSAAIDRLRSTFGAVGASSAPVMAYAPGGPEQAPATTGQTAAWGHVFGSWGRTDGDGNAARLSRSTGGFLAGVDATLADTWRVGVLAGYSRSSFKANARASSGESDNYHLGLYAGTKWQGLGVRGGLAHTWHDVDIARSVAFPGFSEQLSAGYRAGTFQVFGEIGHEIDAGLASFEPFVNLAHVNLRTTGFTEAGGDAALSGVSRSTDVTFTTLGLRAETSFALGAMQATARGMVGWRHAFGDTTPLSTHGFVGGDPFTVAGTPIAKDAAVVEAGLDLEITEAATLGISYNGQFGSGARDNGVRGTLAVSF